MTLALAGFVQAPGWRWVTTSGVSTGLYPAAVETEVT